jgi:MHS family proline/betaine transporter-like MFS transporter
VQRLGHRSGRGRQEAAAGSRRTLLAACVGNATEWYDFAIFGAFATVLASVFFPTGNRAGALAATFAVFATSFVMRPVGALVVGPLADRIGRRAVLPAVVGLMAVATGGIGLLPPWSSIGVAAPAALLILRMVQGFSAGGELGSSVTFLVESAPESQRGRYGGWHTASAAVGLAAGIGSAALLSILLSRSELEQWGWRLAFLLALPVGLISVYIRLRLAEPPAFQQLLGEVTRPRITDVLRMHPRDVRSGFVLVAALTLAYNVWFVFMPSYVAYRFTVPLGPALGCAVAGLGAATIAAPLMGRLSDRIGRRPVLLGATVALTAAVLPCFVLARSGSVGYLLVSSVVMGAVLGSLALPAFLAELFATAVRTTGLSLTYGVGSAVVGGTAPLVATVLTGVGADWLVAAYVLAVAGLAAAVSVGATETAFGPLVQR